MKIRRVGVALVVAGGMMTAVWLSRLIFPTILDFLLTTLAHLVMAFAVAGLAQVSIGGRLAGILLGLGWGIGWLLLFLREALMIAWIIPPAWFGLGDPLLLFGGLAVGIVALLQRGGSEFESVRLPSYPVLIFAVLTSLFVWFGVNLDLVFPSIDYMLQYGIRIAEDVLLALVTLGMGILLLTRSRQARIAAAARADDIASR